MSKLVPNCYIKKINPTCWCLHFYRISTEKWDKITYSTYRLARAALQNNKVFMKRRGRPDFYYVNSLDPIS